jgi:DUF1680 family protein
MQAMKTVWEDVVYRNMYITGGIGSSGRNEGFSHDYDLPNESAYCETCASVGMVFWNQRMNLLTGESKYVDVLERSLYNGALDGLSLSGDRFFYGNPLASSGQYARSEWFGTACCPFQHLPPGGVAGRLRLRQIRQCHLGQPVRGQQHHHSP